jgi:hypothetical protein
MARRDPRIPVRALLIARPGLLKLAARGITEDEAKQLLRNPRAMLRKRARPEARGRRLLVGRTDGGRILTLVLERTIDPTTWLVVTGWDSSRAERTIFWRQR